MRTPSRLLIVAAVMLAGCTSPLPVPTGTAGETSVPPTADVTPAPSADPAPPSPTPAPDVAVNVRQEPMVREGIVFGLYTEGAYAFVEIRSADGSLVASAETDQYHIAGDLLRAELATGSYELFSYVRPCEAACPLLDGPTDECRQTFEVRSGRDIVIVIRRAVGRPCEIAVS